MAQPQVTEISKYEDLPGQAFRNKDSTVVFWRRDDYDSFSVIPKTCDQKDHLISMHLDKRDLLYRFSLDILPELTFIEKQEDLPKGIYQTEEEEVMAQSDLDNDEFSQVHFFSEDASVGNVFFDVGYLPEEVVAEIRGQFYCIPLKWIPTAP